MNIIPEVDCEEMVSKVSKDFDVIIDLVLECLVYACKTFDGHSACLCFMCVRHCIMNSNSGD